MTSLRLASNLSSFIFLNLASKMEIIDTSSYHFKPYKRFSLLHFWWFDLEGVTFLIKNDIFMRCGTVGLTKKYYTGNTNQVNYYFNIERNQITKADKLTPKAFNSLICDATFFLFVKLLLCNWLIKNYLFKKCINYFDRLIFLFRQVPSL